MDVPHVREQMSSAIGVRLRLVNQKLLLQNEFLAAKIAFSALTLPAPCAFRNPSDRPSAEIRKGLSRSVLQQVAGIARS